MWVEEPTQIEIVLINDLSTRFKSAHVNFANPDMEMLNLVLAKDIDRILQAIHDFDIKETIFQMDKFKSLGRDGFGAAFF